MDPFTHALTSFVLARGFFPRRPWWFVLGMILAGTIADLDLLSALVGPGAYLEARHTFTHSIVGSVAVIAIAVGSALALRTKSGAPQKPNITNDPGIVMLVVATSVTAVVHVLLDVCTSAGVALFWPWRQTRFAWDWLPRIDPWILGLLLAGIMLPELFGLVGSEIGTKSKTPRGRKGAIAALALALIYVGARVIPHGNAVAQLDAHTFRGESPRRLAAFADPVSLVNWHGLVETETQICTVSVPGSEGARFDSESAVCMHKPENSPALVTAQQTERVKKFLQSARFPKASVGPTADGTEVVVRDMRNIVENDKRYAVAAYVLLDRNGQVTSQLITWESGLRLR